MTPKQHDIDAAKLFTVEAGMRVAWSYTCVTTWVRSWLWDRWGSPGQLACAASAIDTDDPETQALMLRQLHRNGERAVSVHMPFNGDRWSIEMSGTNIIGAANGAGDSFGEAVVAMLSHPVLTDDAATRKRKALAWLDEQRSAQRHGPPDRDE